MFYELLPFTFDLHRMLAGIEDLKEIFNPVEITEEFGGWSLQSRTGNWKRAFGGTIYPSFQHNLRTELCQGIWKEILDDLEERGFHPRRARISILQPGAMKWHRDSEKNDYCARIHIPIITNEGCFFEVKHVGEVHMQANGEAYLVDASTVHRARNDGEELRYHFLADVWDTQAYSTGFRAQGNEPSYLQMIAYEKYGSLIDAHR